MNAPSADDHKMRMLVWVCRILVFVLVLVVGAMSCLPYGTTLYTILGSLADVIMALVFLSAAMMGGQCAKGKC